MEKMDSSSVSTSTTSLATSSSAYAMLQECARQYMVPFKRFDELEANRWYQVDKYILTHGAFGTKMAVRIKNIAAYGGQCLINLPDRFKFNSTQVIVDELNAEEEKGLMFYGGKDAARKNRINIDFDKHQLNNIVAAAAAQAFHHSTEIGSIDVPY